MERIHISLTSTFYFWTYAFGQILGDVIASKFNPKKIISLGLLVTGILNVAIGITSVWYSILLLWALNGLALALFWPAIVKICATSFSDKEYGQLSVVLNLPTTLGYFISWLALGLISKVGGWHMVFIVPGITAFLFIFLWKYLDYTCDGIEKSDKEIKKTKPFYKVFFTVDLLSLALVVMLEGGIRESMNLWAPSFISTFNVMVGGVNIVDILLLIIPLITTIGLVFTSLLLKKLNKPNDAIIIVFSLIVLVFSFLFYIFDENFTIAVFSYGIFLAAIYSSAALITTLVPFRYFETGYSVILAGVMNFLAYVGASLGSFFSGLVIDKSGWKELIFLWFILNLVCCLILIVKNIFKKVGSYGKV